MTDATGDRPTPAPPPREEALAAFLLACDAALAIGLVPLDPTPFPSESPDPEIGARLAQARACLALLHRRWPWPAGQGRNAPGDLSALNLKFGRYEIRGLLGRGGHGIVFRAFDPALKRLVALKVPRPEAVASPELRGRFLREAEAVARLDHPGIVPVFDLGESGPVCYLAAAYVAGPDLATWIAGRSGPCPPHQAAAWALAMTEAVAHAHARGVLHRDLKPSNVLLEMARGEGSGAGEAEVDPSGSSLLPRITDFGLAKLYGGPGDETQTGGTMLGTPRYMAPEQATGRRERIGPRTDLYGLGAILHALLCGEPPDTPAKGVSGVLLAEAVPADLKAIVARCLQAHPADRYPSAESLADDLRRFLGGKPVRARARPRRKRARRIMVGLGVVALIGLGVWSRWPPRPSRTSAPESGRALEAARNERRARYVEDIRRAHRLIVVHRANQPGDLLATSEGASFPEVGRGFERGYLERLARRNPATLTHLGKRAQSPRYSPDGRWLATGGEDGTVRLWDAETLAPGAVLRHHVEATTGVTSLDWSPDGRLLASACGDGMVWLWDVASARPRIEAWRAHSVRGSIGVRFTPDGRHLLTAGNDRRLALWDAATGASIREVSVPEGIASGDVAPDGSFLCLGLEDESLVALYDLDLTSRRTFSIPSVSSPQREVLAVAVSPDSRVVAAGGYGRVSSFLRPSDGNLEKVIQWGSRPSTSLAFSPDGSVIAAGGDDREPTVQLWEVSSGALLDTLRSHTGTVWSIAFSPDGRRLATASRDTTVKVWQVSNLERTLIYPPTGATPTGVGLTPDGSRIRVILLDGTIASYDAATGDFVGSQRPEDCQTLISALSPDAATYAVLIDPHKLVVHDLAARASPKTVVGRHFPHQAITFTSDSRFLPLVDEEAGERLVIDVATGQVVERLPRNEQDFALIQSTLLGHWRALTTDWRRLVLEHRRTRSAPDDSELTPTALAVSSDLRRLALGDDRGNVQIRDLPSFSRRSTVDQQAARINVLAFSPDGRLLVSGDHSGVLLLIDVATGRVLFPLEGAASEVRSLRFSLDGRTLAGFVLSPEPAVIVWHGSDLTHSIVNTRRGPVQRP